MVVAFTNLVADVDAVTMRAHATVNGAAAAITVAPVNEATMAITPDVPWPAGATVVVTLDPGVTSVAGDTLAAPATVTFMIRRRDALPRRANPFPVLTAIIESEA